MSNAEFQAVQRVMAAKLATFNDQITQNEALFKRIETVYNSPEKKRLNAEQQRLVWLYYTNAQSATQSIRQRLIATSADAIQRWKRR